MNIVIFNKYFSEFIGLFSLCAYNNSYYQILH